MALAVLIAGIVAFLAGLLAILYGIPIREFSVGSTFILVGALGVCTGMLLAGLYVAVTELKAISRRLAGTTAPSDVRVRPVLPGIPTAGMTAAEPADTMQVEPTPSAASSIPAAPPWQDATAARERPRVEAPPIPAPPEPGTEAPRRRNLLFESTSRKERERAQAKTGEGSPLEAPPGVPASVAPPQPSPADFDDAWPKPDRMRPPETSLQRRPPMPPPPPRMPSAATEPAPPPPAAPPATTPSAAPAAPAPAEQPAVTVLKSGVVDGMAYSLYSDGSIEAQMPEGMMRFASIDELRSHLDQRG